MRPFDLKEFTAIATLEWCILYFMLAGLPLSRVGVFWIGLALGYLAVSVGLLVATCWIAPGIDPSLERSILDRYRGEGRGST